MDVLQCEQQFTYTLQMHMAIKSLLRLTSVSCSYTYGMQFPIQIVHMQPLSSPNANAMIS